MSLPPNGHCYDCWERGVASLIAIHDLGIDCAICGRVWSAPHFLRQCRRQLPEGWPLVGYRAKEERVRKGKKVMVTVTYSAHDLHVKLLQQAVKDYRAEYLAQRSPEVAREEEFLRQSMLF